MRIILTLSPEHKELLERPVAGSGGWQTLLRKLQKNLSGLELSLDPELLRRMLRYTNVSGPAGGFEQRLDGVLSQIYGLLDMCLGELGYSFPNRNAKHDLMQGPASVPRKSQLKKRKSSRAAS